MSTRKPKPSPGLEQRHGRSCPEHEGGDCRCAPAWRATVYDARTGRRVRKTFSTKTGARQWRDDAAVAIRRGEVAPTIAGAPTVERAVMDWLAAARTGAVRTRGRKPFAPTTIRSVEQNYRKRVRDRFGRCRLDHVRLLDVQDWIDDLHGQGVHASTIETSVLPLRLAYRRAKGRGDVLVDPTDGVELPQKPAHGTARKPPSPDHIGRLLELVPDADRAVWATFVLCGVRRGEALALRWRDVDLDAGTLRIERSYTPGAGYGPPKSRNGTRTVPVAPTLVALLREHKLRTGRRDGLVFGYRPDTPLDAAKLQARADAAWKAADPPLARVTPHVCRHLYASVMAAAGVSPHALSTYMGHSSIAVTFDRYGHLFPGDEAQASTLQEAFLARAASQVI